jgi:hypothetical protein
MSKSGSRVPWKKESLSILPDRCTPDTLGTCFLPASRALANGSGSRRRRLGVPKNSLPPLSVYRVHMRRPGLRRADDAGRVEFRNLFIYSLSLYLLLIFLTTRTDFRYDYERGRRTSRSVCTDGSRLEAGPIDRSASSTGRSKTQDRSTPQTKTQ